MGFYYIKRLENDKIEIHMVFTIVFFFGLPSVMQAQKKEIAAAVIRSRRART